MNQSHPNVVNLAGTLVTTDVSDVLSMMKTKGSITGGQGFLNFNIAYQGDLFKPELSSIRGHAELELEDGNIQGVSPGIGRILSLLNVDTIRRRLRLDFSDLTKSGLTFDSMYGKFNVSRGKVSTDNLTLVSTTADIEFMGELDLVSKDMDASMTVMPNITGSLPLAAAIAAGNPAVGAAVWLMDKIVGKKIQRLTRFNYVVSGDISAPNIQEVTQTSSSRDISRR